MTHNDRTHWIACKKYKLAVALALSSALGCYEASNGPGSGETHFLRGCSEDVGCASGLECVCGVCTVRCDDNNTCKDQNELASCRPSDCSEERICDVECVNDGDCTVLGSDYTCKNKHCRFQLVDIKTTDRTDSGPDENENPNLECQPPHRDKTVVCSGELDEFNPPPDRPRDELNSAQLSCNSDSECTDYVGGHCHDLQDDLTLAIRQCVYDACYIDAHCGDEKVCECGNGVVANRCVTANCLVDEDCSGEQGYCSPSPGSCGPDFGIGGYFCHSENDECFCDTDCPGDDEYGDGYCAYDTAIGSWRCKTERCAGRPG